MSYEYIYCPDTKKNYSIHSKKGQQLIESYLQEGGRLTLEKLLNQNKEPIAYYTFHVGDDFLTDEQYDLYVDGKEKVTEVRLFIEDTVKASRGDVDKKHNQNFRELMKVSIIHPLIYKHYPMITFYMYADYLFVRPAYSNISGSFQCTSKNNMAGVIAELLEPFSSEDIALNIEMYLNCLQAVRSLVTKFCPKCKSKKKCRKHCI